MPIALAVRTGASLDVPAAVSTAVAPLLRTPVAGTVLACFPAAVYVQLASGAVLAVVTSDGLRLPNSLVVAASSREAPFARHTPGGAAAVADGVLVLDGVGYRPVRTWAPREGTAGALQRSALATLDDQLPAAPHTGDTAHRLRAGTTRLGAALRTGDGLAGAADGLLGLGPGLTPAGDDVLAGVLVTYAHLGPGLPALASRVRERAHVTTTLSADLLHHAGERRAAAPVLGLLDALVGARPVAPALADLLAVGSTSGHDTATGVLLAARALLDRREDA
jgi:hypothetical protein